MTDNTTNKEMKKSFVNETMVEMIATMNDWGTNPGTSAKNSLSEIPSLLWDLHHDQAEEKGYLCPLECGVGKTTAVKFSFKTMEQRGLDYSALMMFYKIAEAKDVYDDLKEFLGEDKVALITSEHSDDDAWQKPVLIITQQRFCSKLTSPRLETQPHYNDVEAFHYRGNPRKIKVWDEKLMPAVSYTLTLQEFRLLAASVKDEDNADLMLAWWKQVKGLIKEGNTTIHVPNFRFFSTDFHKSADSGAKETLLAIQGKEVSARASEDDKGKSQALMSYRVEIPRDKGVFPLLVLDASFRVNKSAYEAMNNSLPLDLDNLVGAGFSKSYANLEVLHANIATGGENYKEPEKLEVRLDIIRRRLLEVDPEEVLVFCSKANKNVIKANLGIPKLPHFLTWGRHAATNDYKHIKHIIIADLYYKSDFVSEGYLRAYKGLEVSDEVSLGEIREFSKGELRDAIYQATLRGAARQLDGVVCKEMSMLIMGSTIKSALGWDTVFPECFPGSTLKPYSVPLAGKNSKKLAILVERFLNSNDDEWKLDDSRLSSFGLTRGQLKKLREKGTKQSIEIALWLDTKGLEIITNGRAGATLLYNLNTF